MSLSLEWKDRPVKYLRDKIVDQLKYNLVHDHLEIEEFEQLVQLALRTPSKSELLSLIADLPKKEDFEIENQEQELAPYRKQESIVGILSQSKRKGMWIPSKQLKVVSILGETELDFRDVKLAPGLTYISLECWLGASTIIIPAGVNVVSNVKNILGSVDGGSQGRMNPDSPTIVLEGKVILGELNIKVKT